MLAALCCTAHDCIIGNVLSRQLHVIAALLGFLALRQGDAHELVLACPSEIPAASIRYVEGQPGWRMFVRGKLQLHSASFMGGEPEQMMDLVPFQVNKSGASIFERWKFDGDDVWLRCAYGAAGQITLSRRVEGKLAECTVNYDRNLPSRIVCVAE